MQSASKASFDSRVNIVRFFTINGFRLYLQWSFSRQPIYWLPKGWIPWYGEWILSFPYAPRGSVSVQVWQLACGSVLTMIMDAIKYIILFGLTYAAKSKRGVRYSEEKAPRMKQAF
jgi:hypothetical protein